MDKINIKGISFKIDNIYFVDIVPNETIKQILDQQKYSDAERECALKFLNVGCSSNVTFVLSTWIPEAHWIEFEYEFFEEEKQNIVNFINEWKDKLPTRTCADDFEFVNALSDDIPWKQQVMR